MANTLNLGNGNWATKEDSLLAYNSENGNFKPLPFDFTRASSATVVNKAGLIETVGSGEPRIDFSNDAKGALLLEPTRNNLIPYSEDFSNSIWTNTGAATSVNPTADLSPDGNLTGNEFNEGTSSGRRGVFEDISVSANQSYTLSVFVKKGTSNLFRIVIAENVNSSNWTALQVDLSDNSLTTENGSNNSFTDISSSISDSDYNGYYRLTLTAKHTTVTSLRLLFNMAQSAIASSNSYGRADYTGTNKTVFVWGCQLESNSSYATSYIPTQGGIVTRNSDSCSQTVPSGVIGQTEGVIFLDVKMPSAIQSNTTFSIGGGTNGEYAQLEIRSDLSINWRYRQGDTDYINANVGSYVGGDRLKIAFAYKSGSSILYKNGVSIATDNGSIGSNSWNNVYFANYAGTGNLNADVNQLSLYNTRLSNAELQALTSN